MKAFLAILFCFLGAGELRAASSFEIDSDKDKHHVTADRTLYHSREKVYEAFGHVVVSSRGQRLSCDYLWFDSANREIKARGNVVFVDRDTTIQAAELQFNLDTGFGSIFYGRVSNDYYSLKGQLIRKVSDDRFLTTEGEYTTCKDCAESWKLSARHVDMTVDGYAFMDGVFVKIKDIPTLYIPYLVVPVKTKRQSGLLFPRISAGTIHGFVFVQPLYLTLGKHQDVTLGYGKYSSQGARYEFEHRYKSYNGIEGQLNFFRTNDRKTSFTEHRTAFFSNNKWPFSKNFEMRWRAYEVLDRDYPLDFQEDIPGKGLPSLESNAVASAPFDDFFISVEAKRYRNLLYNLPKGFDGGTVQALPTVHLGIKDRKIAGPLLAGFYGRYDRYHRHNGSFQDENNNRLYDRGQDTIRETDRTILQPTISAPFRFGKFISIGPSLQYNEIRYTFNVPTATGFVPTTQTRYLLARVEASTVFEKVFAYEGETVSKLKHQMVPFITLSNIPWIQQGDRGSYSHPFNGSDGQLEKTTGLFDQYDIVPLTNNTNFLRYPQGKSIYYGFTSRLIRKMRSADERGPRAYPYDLLGEKPREYPTPLNRKMELQNEYDRLWEAHNPRYDAYQEVWTVNATQAYDFKIAEQKGPQHADNKKRAFSYLLAKSDVNLERFSHSLEYRFSPRIVSRTFDLAGVPTGETVYHNKHYIGTSFTWYLENLTNLRKTRSFVRSISATFTNSSQPNPSRTVGGILNWSFSDFVNFRLEHHYDLLARNQMNWAAQTIFTHHSECWGLATRYSWDRARTPQRSDIGFQVLWNPMGTGFLGASGSSQGGPGGVFGGM